MSKGLQGIRQRWHGLCDTTGRCLPLSGSTKQIPPVQEGSQLKCHGATDGCCHGALLRNFAMTTRQPLYKSLYFQVIVAIAIGILVGHFYPQTGVALKPLGDGFIKLIKMIIAPIIFCTVVSGIAGMQSMKSVGKTGGYALLYFEIVSTIALLVGLVVVNIVQPGAGMHIDVSTLDASKVAQYVAAGADQSVVPGQWRFGQSATGTVGQRFVLLGQQTQRSVAVIGQQQPDGHLQARSGNGPGNCRWQRHSPSAKQSEPADAAAQPAKFGRRSGAKHPRRDERGPFLIPGLP